MSEQPYNSGSSSQQTYSPPIRETKATTLPPVNYLPLRKRLALDSTIRTPKKQFVKQLQLDQQRIRQEQVLTTTRSSPKIDSAENPLTPGLQSSDSSTTFIPSKNEEILMKKQPPKKAYHRLSTLSEVKDKKPTSVLADHSRLGHISSSGTKLPGNPLLCNNGNVVKYAPEDTTIDSFKSAWLEGTDDMYLDQEDTCIVAKEKPAPAPASLLQRKKSHNYHNKRGRPPSVSKSTVDSDSYNPITTSNRKTSCSSVPRAASNGRSRSDGKLYCICRQPYDTTRFMIACDRCDDWFHGECIRINEKESEFIDLYFCNKCAKITGKKTSWKPKCSNPACHTAARIGSHVGHLSKYCSHSCGMQVARARLELAEIKRRKCVPSASDQVPIAQLALEKQRQLRINSFADRQDYQRLEQINQQKVIIRDNVQAIDEKCRFLSDVGEQTQKICGFDDRLIWPDLIWKKIQPPKEYHVCERASDCSTHQQWHSLVELTFEQERKEQYHILIKLERERGQIKSRMRKRRSNQEMIKDLINSAVET